MAENLSTALQITVIGMGLVFGGILLLWGLMSLMLKMTTPKDEETKGAADVPTETDESYERKRLVAAMAVALALAEEEEQQKPRLFPMPPTAIVSAWQAVMRTNQLRRRGTR